MKDMKLSKTAVYFAVITTAIFSFFAGRFLYFYTNQNINSTSSRILQHERGDESEERVLEHMDELTEIGKSKKDETCSAQFCELPAGDYGKVQHHDHLHWSNENVMKGITGTPLSILKLVEEVLPKIGVYNAVHNQCHSFQSTGLICTFAAKSFHLAIRTTLANGSDDGLHKVDFYLNGEGTEIDHLYQKIRNTVDEHIKIANKRPGLDMNAKEVYNEALVHPILISHPHPRNVAILKGFDQERILKEVLKHKRTQKVTMYEYTPAVNNSSLEEWQNCGHFLGLQTSRRCVNDERVDLQRHQAFSNSEIIRNDQGLFDVAIMNM